jgi:hypothetical protein
MGTLKNLLKFVKIVPKLSGNRHFCDEKMNF